MKPARLPGSWCNRYPERMPRASPHPRAPRRPTAWVVAVCCAAALWTSTVRAESPLAELTVVAYGAQRFDLATGRTVLDAGGEVTDRASGVRLVAAWIAYVDGASLEAHDATIEGAIGRVAAARVEIDLAQGRMIADGGVTIERAGIRAAAERLGLDGPAGLVWLAGAVRADAPVLSADVIWIDVADGRIVLVGPYRFADGPLTLEGDAGARLQLDPIVVDGAAFYDARSDVGADLAERIAATATSFDPATPVEP
jgi:hypothetical protein